MSRQRTSKVDRTTRQHDVLHVRPLASRDELEQSLRLVYRNYLQRGYVSPNESGIRLSIFNFLPGTITFVGLLGGDIVSTVSLVPDTPMGLPMDEVFRDELQPLRDSERRLAEVIMLADRRTELRRTLPMLLDLMKLLFDYATLVLKANDLCITINPRHVAFYKRYLLFTPMGEVRQYASVCDNPALAERLDLDNVRSMCEGNEKLLTRFFQNRTPIEVFEKRYNMTQDDMYYFGVQRSALFRNITPKELGYLREVRPDCPWDEWQQGRRPVDVS